VNAGGDRTERPPEGGRGFRLRQPVEVAQHQRGAVLLRQEVEFRVDQRGDLVPHRGLERAGLGGRRFPDRGYRLAGAGLEGGVVGDATQPAAEGIGANGAGLPGEGEERGLEGVLGRMAVAGDGPAHPPDRVGVATEEQLEGDVAVGAGADADAAE
jgi:hypothetical protein